MKKILIDLICKKWNLDKKNLYMLRSNHKDSKDGDFKQIFNSSEYQKNSLLDYSRAYFLYQNLKNLSDVNGSIAECGTYKGGGAFLIAKTANKNTPIHLFDTFEGMPDLIGAHDTHKKGDLKDTSFEHVQTLLSAFKNVTLHKGLFSDTFKSLNSNELFKFVHCDADIYQSVHECNEFFYDKLVPGGIIIYDDYGWASTKGAQKAVLDFFQDKPEYPIYLPTRQAYIIKR